MSTMTTGVELLLACVLAVAASQKVLARPQWRAARAQLAPAVPDTLWMALPPAEAAVALSLALGIEPWSAIAATVLFASFGLTLLVAYARGSRADCNCFGALFAARVGRGTIVRAAGLTLAALALVLAGVPDTRWHGLGPSVPLTVAAVVAVYDALKPLIAR